MTGPTPPDAAIRRTTLTAIPRNLLTSPQGPLTGHWHLPQIPLPPHAAIVPVPLFTPASCANAPCRASGDRDLVLFLPAACGQLTQALSDGANGFRTSSVHGARRKCLPRRVRARRSAQAFDSTPRIGVRQKCHGTTPDPVAAWAVATGMAQSGLWVRATMVSY